MRNHPVRSSTTVWLIAVTVTWFVVLGLLYHPGWPGLTSGDFAQYLLHAQAVAEGRGYTDIPYIYTDLNPEIGPRAYPPGVSLVLAVVMLASGSGALLPIHGTMLLLGALLVGVVTAYFTRRGPMIGFTVGLFTATSLAPSATDPTSDIPFALAFWTVILLTDRSKQRQIQWLLVAAAGITAIMTRSVGMVLIPGALAYAALHWRQTGRQWLLLSIIWTATYAVTNVSLPVTASYFDQVPRSPVEFATVLGSNIAAGRFAVFSVHLYPFPWNPINDGYHLVTGFLMLLGLVLWTRRHAAAFLFMVLGFYVVVVAMWPAFDGRMLIPIYPLFVYWLVLGAQGLWRRAQPVRSDHRLRLAAMTVVGIVLLHTLTREEDPNAGSFAALPEVQDVLRVLETDRQRQSVRAVFVKPRVLAWETGLPAMAFFPGSPSAILADLKTNGITHVILGSPRWEEPDMVDIEGFSACLAGGYERLPVNRAFTILRWENVEEVELRGECAGLRNSEL